MIGRSTLVRSAAPWVVAVIGSTVLAAWLYRVWQGDFGVPWVYSGDAFQNGMLFKAVVEDGDIWNNDRLGAPFVQHFQDWPLTDLLPIYLGKVLSIFTTNWAALLNAVYLLTFPFVALSAWWVMRRLGVSPWVACALSIVYALAPYHFGRGESHLFLSGYYGAPLGVWLAISILRDEPLFAARSRGGRFRGVSWTSGRTVMFSVVIALSSVYYMTFTAVMLLAAIGVCLIRRRWRSIAAGVGVIAILGATFLLAAAPTLLYRAENGPNVLGAERAASDTEAYGLKLSQMLLPRTWHRVDAFADLRQRYVSTFPIPSESTTSALGAMAAAGLVWLLGFASYAVVTGRRRDDRHGELSFLVLVLFLVATVGGVATLVSLLLTSQVRGWNRVSIVMAFLALSAIGLLADRVVGRRPVLSRRVVAAPVLALVVAAAAWDQYSPAFGFAYEDNEREFRTDAAFFSRVEAVLPTGAAVFQLPRVAFPEPLQLQYEEMDAYDPMRPFLHTNDIRWSYGGIEGRAEYEWQRRLEGMTTAELVDAVSAAGFQGIYVDRRGYADRAASLERDIARATGGQPMVSDDGRMAFFDLRAYAARLESTDPRRVGALREDLLFPVITQVSGRAYRHQVDDGELVVWAPPETNIPVVNESSSPKRALITFELESGDGRPANFEIEWPDGSRQSIVAGGAPVAVSHALTVAPGRSDVEITSDAPPVAPAERWLRSFKIRDTDVSPAPR